MTECCPLIRFGLLCLLLSLTSFFFLFLSSTLLAISEERPTAESSPLAPGPSVATPPEAAVSHDGEFNANHVLSTSFEQASDPDKDLDVIYTHTRHEALLSVNKLIAWVERGLTKQSKGTKEIPPYNGDEYKPDVAQFVNSEPIMETEEDWNFTITPPMRPVSVPPLYLEVLREVEEV